MHQWCQRTNFIAPDCTRVHAKHRPRQAKSWQAKVIVLIQSKAADGVYVTRCWSQRAFVPRCYSSRCPVWWWGLCYVTCTWHTLEMYRVLRLWSLQRLLHATTLSRGRPRLLPHWSTKRPLVCSCGKDATFSQEKRIKKPKARFKHGIRGHVLSLWQNEENLALSLWDAT